jgi:hypothetical protein
LNSKIESLIVFGVVGGILLPARLLFVEFVSDDWLGSFGVISILSLAMIFLAKKNKLGFFGSMLERQIFKFQKGKRGILIFAESVFLLVILGMMIFTIDQGHTIYAEQKMECIPESLDQKTHVLESAKNMTSSDWVFGAVMAPLGLSLHFLR